MLYEEYLEKRKSILSENHPDTLMSMNNLAGLYDEQGQECLEKRKSILGENHPDTLESMHNSALL
jgi:hypothetical protein